MGETEKINLVDFLYQDTQRINSFYAQIFRGYLQSVQLTSSESIISKSEAHGNVAFAKGIFKSEDVNSDTIGKQIDPHDQRIIDMLEYLNIPINNDSLSKTTNGQIVLIKGQLALRNYETIKNALPILFGIMSSAADPLAGISLSFIEPMLNLIPMGLELEVKTANNEVLLTSLKQEYLLENPNDLLSVYGNHLPGEWFILGIIDRSVKPQFISPTNELRKSIDEFAEMIKQMYGNIEYSITPILIFRNLTT